MGLDKKSLKSDAIVNFYRAALYLAQGNPETGLEFLQKANSFFSEETESFQEILGKPEALKEEKNRLFWAEKILDKYQKYRLKNTDR